MRKLLVLVAAVLVLTLLLTRSSNRATANPIPVDHSIDPDIQNPVQRLGSSLSLGEPVSYRNLRIYPLLAENQNDRAYEPIDRAIERGDLEVHEKGSGEVNTVKVRNNGSSQVFGMAGDMIVGARQDRMLQQDVLIPPNSGWIELDVFCTEHGRWTDQTREFGTNNRVVPGALRATASQTQSQSEVWAGVAEAKSVLKTEAGGTALRGVFDDSKVQEQAQAFVRELMPVPDASARTIGVLVAVGDEVLCLDVFANHALLSAMWSKLLNSYAIDALSRDGSGRLDPDEARQFVRSLENASLETRTTPGIGKLYRVSTARGSGSALVQTVRVVHADLFPERVHKGSEYEGPTPNLEFRRGQH